MVKSLDDTALNSRLSEWTQRWQQVNITQFTLNAKQEKHDGNENALANYFQHSYSDLGTHHVFEARAERF